MDKWVWTFDKTELVNTHHVLSLKREAPALAQKEYIVYAQMKCGTKIMYRGNRDECTAYMDNFGKETKRMINGVDWGAYNALEWVDEQYLPLRGEGETMATQAVTAVAKLVYKWYNDGDVFDNTHHMQGWCNDLSSYANWLYRHVPRTRSILDTFVHVYSDEQYEQLLWELTNAVETEEHLAELNKKKKVGSIYECDGPFEFNENY